MRPVVLKAGSTPSMGDVITWDGVAWVPEGPRARPHDTLFVNTKSIVHIVQGPYQSPDFVSGSAGWQFDADGSLEANNIIARGTIYASAGEIGGYTIAADNLYAGTGANRVGLAPGTYPFYAGSETPASAPFRVTAAGALVATDATLTGTITATAGAIAGWDITPTEFKSGTNIVLDSSVPSIVIGASGYIQSNNYVSGFDGFHIDNDFAEFGNINVRGSLHCAVFVKDLISAHAGSLLVTKSAGKLTGDYTTAGVMEVETPPGGSWLFDTGDIVRLKEEYASGVHESWVTVTRAILVNVYSTVLSDGDSTTYHAGTTAVDYGASGDGGILETADMGNAPWLSVFTHAGAPWTTLTHHLRLGNLNGVGGYSSDKYGIFIGDYAGNKWMSYDPTNSLRIRGDALIEGTVTAEKLYMGIGDSIFDADDGLLLLGPSCEINDGAWWSLRKQKATITGAFHQEAGRWLGTRGLVIEEGTINLITNPSFETNTTGYATANVTLTSSTDAAVFGTHSGKAIGTGAATYPRVMYQLTGLTAGETYAFQCRYQFDEDPAGSGLVVWNSDFGQNLMSLDLVKTGTWATLRGTFTVSAGQTVVNIWWYLSHTATTATLLLDGVQVEHKDYCTTYCDGSLGHDYSWSGTAHGSTSSRVATAVNLIDNIDLISSNDTLSFSLWWQAPYDADTTWPSHSPVLFDTRGADNNNRTFISYRDDVDKFYVYLNGGYRILSPVQTFDAGDWLHLVLTIDYTNDEYELFINAASAGTDTTALTAPVLTAWFLGGNYIGGYTTGGNFGEYAVIDKVVSATEVAAMYALQRALVDAAAMDKPGIYILDGKFKMASGLTGNRIEIDADEIAGYGSTGTKQFYLRASDGTAMAGGGAIILNSLGKETHGTGDADIYDKWYNEDITVYSDAFGFANLQKTAPDSNTYGVMNFGIRHNATNQSNIACWLNEVDIYVEKAGNARYLLEANYDYVRIVGVPFRVAQLAADPTVSIENGMLFYHTGTHKLRLRANGAWVNLN